MRPSSNRKIKPAGKGRHFLCDGDTIVASVTADFHTCYAHWVRAGLDLDSLPELLGSNFHLVESVPECSDRSVKPAGKGAWFLYTGDVAVAKVLADFNACSAHWVRARLGLDSLQRVFGESLIAI